MNQYLGTGRRKTSVARVYLRPGSGRILVNKTDLDAYFDRESVKLVLRQPLEATQSGDSYDIVVTVRGGGKASQAGAIRLGISRALVEANPAHRATLKARGMLTRDARKVERKKYGQPGARKKFQFSKR